MEPQDNENIKAQAKQILADFEPSGKGPQTVTVEGDHAREIAQTIKILIQSKIKNSNPLFQTHKDGSCSVTVRKPNFLKLSEQEERNTLSR